MKFSIAVLFAAFATVSAQESNLKNRLVDHRDDQFRDNKSTLTAIKENHERRMSRLEEMIEERRRMTEDHESGRRLLSDEEYDRASRQLRNFQRKLDQMKKRTEDDHLERMEELKSLNNMNRIDYLDIKDNLGSK